METQHSFDIHFTMGTAALEFENMYLSECQHSPVCVKYIGRDSITEVGREGRERWNLGGNLVEERRRGDSIVFTTLIGTAQSITTPCCAQMIRPKGQMHWLNAAAGWSIMCQWGWLMGE